jgi:hypothetical protein
MLDKIFWKQASLFGLLLVVTLGGIFYTNILGAAYRADSQNIKAVNLSSGVGVDSATSTGVVR